MQGERGREQGTRNSKKTVKMSFLRCGWGPRVLELTNAA